MAIRIGALAKELGVENKLLVERSQQLGLVVKSHMSVIEDAEADHLRRMLKGGRMRVEKKPPIIVAPPPPRAYKPVRIVSNMAALPKPPEAFAPEAAEGAARPKPAQAKGPAKAPCEPTVQPPAPARPVSDKPTAPVGKEQRRSLQLNAIAPEVAKSKSLGRATGDSSDPRRWYEDAEKEMKRATRMLEDGDPEGAGPQLHMAVEKSLKGFLLSKKEKPHRVHSLRLLFVAALRYDKSLEAFRGVVHKIERLRRGRYPGAMTTPSSECDVGDLLEHAKKLVRKLQAAANTERQGPTHHV